MKKSILFSILYLFAATAVLSQNPDSAKSSPVFNTGEKLYLHTDRSVYYCGDTIWFRGYLLNSNINSEQELSRFIYVELIGDTVISRVKIKDSEKGFNGYIKLKRELKQGKYNVRAYTKWMQNFPVEYMFYKEIDINSAMSISGNSKATKKEENNKSDFDLQFFPEGGKYFAETPVKIAFKAIGANGLSTEVKGKLFDSKGSLCCEFESKHLGMGVLSIISPSKDGYYTIVESEDGIVKTFNLPKPESIGASITLSKPGSKLVVQCILINPADSVSKYSISLSNERGSYYMQNLSKANQTFVLDKSVAPKGVNSVLIHDGKGSILAERLFYIYDSYPVQIAASSDKQMYTKRDSVAVSLELTRSEGNPLSGNFSVSVTDSSRIKEHVSGENIVSYMELSGKLSGFIENPGGYFNNVTPETEKYMDLLMMTQGWRNYSVENPQYERELSQSISGYVTGLFNREVKNKILMVLAPKINLNQAFLLNDSKFKMEGLEFNDSTSFLLAVSGKGGAQSFGLNIMNEIFPYKFNRINSSLNNKLHPQNSNSVKVDSVIFDDDVIKRTLNEITVEAKKEYKISPNFNPSPFLTSFTPTQLKQREELKSFGGISIMTYLVSAFPGLYIAQPSEVKSNGFSSHADSLKVFLSEGNFASGERVLLSTRSNSMSGPEEPFLYVDNIKWQSTGMLDMYGLTLDDVENIAFLRGNAGAMFNTLNGVILITTRRGINLKEKEAINIKKITPLGVQQSAQFYSPKYPVNKPLVNPVADYRNTLYWNPCIKTDSSGKAGFFFYTDDKLNNLNVRIEGLLIDGTPFIKAFTLHLN